MAEWNLGTAFEGTEDGLTGVHRRRPERHVRQARHRHEATVIVGLVMTQHPTDVTIGLRDRVGVEGA